MFFPPAGLFFMYCADHPGNRDREEEQERMEEYGLSRKAIEEKIGEKKLMKIKKGLKVAKIVKNVILTILIIVLVFTVITFLLARVNGGTPSVFGYSIHRV